jgi:DNA-binding Lrp family transcriptional regulator
VDDIDRELLALLQKDATQAYAALGKAVGLSSGAAHERVRKLRERGIIRGVVADVDPAAVGYGVLAFVLLDGTSWMGGQETADALTAVPWIEEAHIVAGSASVLLKIRAGSPDGLQDVLKRLYDVSGVGSTNTTVVLQTIFERQPDPLSAPH